MAALERFVTAQDGVFALALSEIEDGFKQTHWIWFVFPQIAGLGQSDMARRFAIVDRNEAVAYLAHPILGPRLREAADALLAWQGRLSTEAILGPIDALKVRSSMTLFEAAGASDFCSTVLDGFYDGSRDELTLSILESI